MGMNNPQMPMNNPQMAANNPQMGINNPQMAVSNPQMPMGTAQMMIIGNAVRVVNNSTNVLDIIRGDHAKILAIAEDIEILRSNNQSAEANQAFTQLVTLATAHMGAEERILYPALESADKAVMLSAIEEHNLTKQEATALMNIPIESDLWEAKFNVMTDITQHHIDEEQSTVFALAKLKLSEQQLKDMGMRFRQEENSLLR